MPDIFVVAMTTRLDAENLEIPKRQIHLGWSNYGTLQDWMMLGMTKTYFPYGTFSPCFFNVIKLMK